MKITSEVKTIEVKEHHRMPWMEASKAMHEIVKKKNEEIKRVRDIMCAFENAGLIGEEKKENSSRGCCVIS
jgi:hypothetical protein